MVTNNLNNNISLVAWNIHKMTQNVAAVDFVLDYIKKYEANWSYIPLKGKSTKTQTEFVSEIKKLAQKAANATDKTEQDSISGQVLQLRTEYLSRH